MTPQPITSFTDRRAAKEAAERLARRDAMVGKRGYHVIYRRGETNFCPGCGRKAWLVGRYMAECANVRCCVALPFDLAGDTP